MNLTTGNRTHCILILFISLSLIGKAIAWPVLDFPKDSRLTVVSDEIVFNGVAMKSWSISSWDPQQKTLDFYRELWEKPSIDGAPGYLEYEVQGWTVLSRLEDGYQITVQLDKELEKTTSGLIGISRIKKPGRAPKSSQRFQVPGDAKIVNDIRAKDQNKKSRTVVALTDASVRRTVNYYRNLYKRNGWREQSENVKYDGHEGFALMFGKKSKEVNIAVNKSSDGTSVVAVLVDF